ncbi:hypothetical protein DPMN_154003 [Dreissena polymorpha]|uniref:Uncharacterized protein n=1 Tax=Dreissena polymorpha TaxID=45954 RepID=A0A9D4FPX7_DREPO|nr:hypothetical protein DPMN_154003 [Dreissena polymorpha]
MMDEGVKEMMNILNRILVSPNIKGFTFTTVITVGDCALSSYVLKALWKELGKKNIPCVRPQLSEISDLLGAVLFGHTEDITT